VFEQNKLFISFRSGIRLEISDMLRVNLGEGICRSSPLTE